MLTKQKVIFSVILEFEIIIHSEFQIAFCENQLIMEKTYVNIIQTMSIWIVERVAEPYSHSSSGTSQLNFIRVLNHPISLGYLYIICLYFFLNIDTNCLCFFDAANYFSNDWALPIIGPGQKVRDG